MATTTRQRHKPVTTSPKPKSKRGRPRGRKTTVVEDDKHLLRMVDKVVASEVDPALTKNLSGGQIQEVLDFLLIESVAPIVKNSNIFDAQICYLLSLVTRNRKRKISALDRETLISMLCSYIETGDYERKIQILTTAKIERGFFYTFVVNFLQEVRGYTDLYQKWVCEADDAEHKRLGLRLLAIEQSVGVDRDKLFPTINICSDWLELAYEFRNSIISNYIRHAYKHAKAFCANKNRNFDFHDVHQNLLTAVTKAIDKYDSSKGAVTSYINFWILNAMTSNLEHGHEYGIAYNIPYTQRRALVNGTSTEVNFSLSLEQQLTSDREDGGPTVLSHLVGAVGADVGLEQQQEMDLIRYLAKHADIRGMARLYQGIDEYFSPKEEQLMLQNMIREGLVDPDDAEVPPNIREHLRNLKSLSATGPKL